MSFFLVPVHRYSYRFVRLQLRRRIGGLQSLRDYVRRLEKKKTESGLLGSCSCGQMHDTVACSCYVRVTPAECTTVVSNLPPFV